MMSTTARISATTVHVWPTESRNTPAAGPKKLQSVTGLNGRSSSAKKPMLRIFTTVSNPSARPTTMAKIRRARGGKNHAERDDHETFDWNAYECAGPQAVEPIRGDECKPDQQRGEDGHDPGRHCARACPAARGRWRGRAARRGFGRAVDAVRP